MLWAPARASRKPGETLLLPDLAITLAAIAEQGADAFYEGRISELLVAEMENGEDSSPARPRRIKGEDPTGSQC